VRGVTSGNGWDHLYMLSYFYGFFVALSVYWLLHTLFPAERQRGGSPFTLKEHSEPSSMNHESADKIETKDAGELEFPNNHVGV
jgi:nucleobase:cation symporter-1, NCS1 family